MRKFKRDRKGRFARVASSGRKSYEKKKAKRAATKKALKKNRKLYRNAQNRTTVAAHQTGQYALARAVKAGNKKNYRAQKKLIKKGPPKYGHIGGGVIAVKPSKKAARRNGFAS